MSKKKEDKMEIVIMPGAFDNFEGTQEELDELMNELNKMVEDGTLMENSEPLDIEKVRMENPEAANALIEVLEDFDEIVYDEDPIEANKILEEKRRKKLN